MLSIFFCVSCIKVVAGMIGEEWEGGLLPCKWKASLLFLSSPWKLDLGRTGEVKELGVIEKWNVFSFLFKKNVSFSKRKHNQDSLLLKKSPLAASAAKKVYKDINPLSPEVGRFRLIFSLLQFTCTIINLLLAWKIWLIFDKYKPSFY